MKNLLAIALIPCGLLGQATTPTPTVATPLSQTSSTAIGAATTVNSASLPGIAIGVGGVWNRGQPDPFGIDTTISIRLIPTSNVYSWTDVLTPYQNASKSTGPIYSTVTTGAAWVVAQNTSGSVSLVLIGQAGFSTSTAGTTPAFTGSIGAAFRLSKTKNIYLFPYFKAASPTLGTTGSVAAFLLQPGVQVLYGFSK